MHSAPLTETITALLRAQHGKSVASVDQPGEFAEASMLVGSYQRDFASLWSIGHTLNEWRDSPVVEWLRSANARDHSLVLIWDSTPVGNVGDAPLATAVTAIDWAVCFSLSIAYSQEGQS